MNTRDVPLSELAAPATQLQVAALFAGVGGLELGLHHAGHRTVLFCENDPEARAVLHRRFPGIPVFPDVRRVDVLADTIPSSVSLLTAGFPCTDFSQAGRTQGFEGGRSDLILQVLKLLRRRMTMGRSVTHVLIENVPNWRVLHEGVYFSRVLSALERLGYRWAYRVIDALAFGLPQRRRRLFVFATLEGDPRAALFEGNFPESEGEFGMEEAAHGFYWTEGTRGLGWGENCVPTLKGGSTVGIPSPPGILLTDGRVIVPSIEDAERLQGFEPGWTVGEEYVVDGGRKRPFKDRRRWVLVGNAVNVRVSEWIGRRVAGRLHFDGDSGRKLTKGDRLPQAAWSDGHAIYEASLSSWPVAEPRTPLEDFVVSRKLLSEKATRGFYERLRNGNLKVGGEAFRKALACHLERMKQCPATDEEEFGTPRDKALTEDKAIA